MHREGATTLSAPSHAANRMFAPCSSESPSHCGPNRVFWFDDCLSRASWSGGFTAICANPPWDKVDFEDTKYFDSVNPEIANTSGTARRKKIALWLSENQAAATRYMAARRKVKGTFHFVKKSRVFPQLAKSVKGVNSIQLDHLFAEQMTSIISSKGRFGALIPTTIANAAGAQHLFKSLVDKSAVSTIFDFDNQEKHFPVHSGINFCMIAASGQGIREPSMRLAFGLRNTKQLQGNRIFELTPDEIKRLNPNTGTLPTFQCRRDADITPVTRTFMIFLNRRVPMRFCVAVRTGRSRPTRTCSRSMGSGASGETGLSSFAQARSLASAAGC